MLNFSKSVKLLAAASVAALGLVAFAPAANARGGVSVGIGLGGIYAPPVTYYAPPVTYYAPPITYYSAPAPTYYYPPVQAAPVYSAPAAVYAPAPVYYYAPQAYYHPRYYAPFSLNLGFGFGFHGRR